MKTLGRWVSLVAALAACHDGPTEPSPPQVAAVKIAPGDTTVRQRGEVQFAANITSTTGEPMTGVTVTWLSRDPEIARVTGSGLVGAGRPGRAIIVAEAGGRRDSVTVTVTAWWQQVTARAHTCAITVDSLAYCWGLNGSGQLGDGSTTDRLRPTRVAGGHRFGVISTGVGHTCGLNHQGAAYCWGLNTKGQLGDSSFEPRLVPTPVATTARFRSISAGGENTCALTEDGRTFCWGGNSVAQLLVEPAGTDIRHHTPVLLSSLPTLTSVSVGTIHICGTTTQAKVYCWGWNELGQVGNGGTTYAASPSPVVGGLSFAQVSAEYFATCAVTTGGMGYCWGYLGADPVSTSPVAVAGNLTFTEIAGIWRFRCGLVAQRAYCWGEAPFTGLGDGVTTHSTTPIAVVDIGPIAQVRSGDYHTCLLTVVGEIHCWGANPNGALGSGDMTTSLTPRRIVEP